MTFFFFGELYTYDYIYYYFQKVGWGREQWNGNQKDSCNQSKNSRQEMGGFLFPLFLNKFLTYKIRLYGL